MAEDFFFIDCTLLLMKDEEDGAFYAKIHYVLVAEIRPEMISGIS